MAAVADEDSRWPFYLDLPALIEKMAHTPSLVTVDDVFTEGLDLNEVARALRKDGGAAEVCGLTLARQGWGRDEPPSSA